MAKQQGKDYAAKAREMVKASEGKQAPTRKYPQRNATREMIEALLFAAVAALFLKSFIVEAYRIPTGSMETTLKVGDFLLVNKFLYNVKTPTSIPFTDVRLPHFGFGGMRAPQNGDIIVFEWPGDRDELHHTEVVNYIKRCVGIPGDTIVVRNKVLSVNGKEFFHPPGMQFIQPFPFRPDQVDPRMFPPGASWNQDQYGPLRVPKKGDVVELNAESYQRWAIFIMREGHTADLTGSGVIIDGKPATSYTVERNYYFMMGDNRDNSEDSRFWGFVPEDNIVGQAMIVYWSWDPSISFANFGKLIGTTRWDRIFHLIH